MAKRPTNRERCPACGEDTQILKAGTFRSHAYEGTRCYGSGMTPEAAESKRVDQGLAPMNSKPAPEVITPEVVAGPGTAVELHQPAAAPEPVHAPEIVAAAEAALQAPGVAGHDEVISLAVQSRILSMSGAAPKLVRDNPYLAFHIALVGRDLGISPSAALELIDVLDTKAGPRLSLSPQLMNGQLRRLGLGAVRPVKRTKDMAVAGAYGPDGTLLGESEFTWEDAVMAELADDRCQAGQHWRSNDGQTKCKCNPGWKRYPKRMLWWRAAGFAADDYFPEASLGLYQPEALGAYVDEEGRPIDPATVELPEGFTGGEDHGNGHARGTQAEPTADGADLWQLQARCYALPSDQKAKLRAARQGNERLRGSKGVIPTHMLSESAFRIMRSLVQGLESEAARVEDPEFGERVWDKTEALADVLSRCAANLTSAMIGSLGGASGLYAAPTVAQPPQDPPAGSGAPAGTQPAESGQEVDVDRVLALIEGTVMAMEPEEVMAELDALGVSWGAGWPDADLRAALIEAEGERQGLRA